MSLHTEPHTLDADFLASPWRRLGASATDALLVIVLHVAGAGLLLLTTTSDSAGSDFLPPASLILNFLYLWLGWTVWGATVGQRLWGLRVVCVNGKRLSAGRALLRCVGYFIACLPLRLGFLPVLWHPRRQGWHDRIAGTMVVRAAAPIGYVPAPAAAREPVQWPVPDFRHAFRGWWAAALVCCILALAVTWPLVLHFGSHRVGGPGDGSLFLWGYWLFARALAHGEALTSTDMVYYPETVSLLYHTMNWFNCVLAVPLLRFFSLTAVYNGLMVFSLAAGSFSMYIAATALWRSRLAALVACTVWGLSPYFTYNHNEHANLQSGQFMPAVLILGYAALVTRRARYALAAGVAVALAGACDWYHLVIVLFGLVVLGTAMLWGETDRRRIKHSMGLTALAISLGLLLLAPLVVPMLKERDGGEGKDSKLAEQTAWRTDAVDFVWPYHAHPLNPKRGQPRPVAEAASPGLLLLICACIAWRADWRRLRPWFYVALAGAILACGPTLKIGGREGYNFLALSALGGVPPNGFNEPWNTGLILHFSFTMLAAPDQALVDTNAVSLPFPWLGELLPPLRPMRCPARFAVLTIMACALVGAWALAYWRRNLRARRGNVRATAIMAVVGAVMLFEHLVVPVALFDTSAHPFYHRLAQDSDDYAVLEVPIARHISEFQLYQTVHGKRLFSGHLARVPSNATRYLDSRPLLRALQAPELVFEPHGSASLELADIPVALLHSRRQQGIWQDDLDDLRRLDTRYIITHDHYLEAKSRQRLHYMLGRALSLPRILREDGFSVYAIPQDS